LEIADRSARRIDAAALETRRRHRGLRVAAARRPEMPAEDIRGCLEWFGLKRTGRALAADRADQRHEHPPHLGLGLPYPRLERGKIRGVAGPRHDPQQILAGDFRFEFVVDAKPQDLREVMIEARRGTQ